MTVQNAKGLLPNADTCYNCGEKGLVVAGQLARRGAAFAAQSVHGKGDSVYVCDKLLYLLPCELVLCRKRAKVKGPGSDIDLALRYVRTAAVA